MRFQIIRIIPLVFFLVILGCTKNNTAPEADSLLYDIYFGEESNPPLIKTDLKKSLYDTIGLSGDEYYYWKIVAKDNIGNISEGPVWKDLEMGLGMDSKEAYNFGYRGTDEANKLKESGTVHWTYPNTGANNHSGFTALPGGRFNSYIGFAAYFWTSTEYTQYSAWVREMGYNKSKIKRTYYLKEQGFSVRCIKNL